MPSIDEQLNDLFEKTSILIARYKALEQESQVLQEENRSLREKVDIEMKKAQALEEETKLLKLAKTIACVESGDLQPVEKTLDTKQKISEFVREIDKCIRLLKSNN